jgi:hypothetical protein
MTDDYDLQLAMMEKRVTDKSNQFTIKRLNEKQNEESENNNNQEVAFLVVNLKEIVGIVVRSGIKQRIVK